MVGCAYFMASVFALLDLAHAPIQDPVAPGWRSFLLAGIVLIRIDIILICRRKRDRGLVERAEAEVWILPFGGE